MSNLTQKSIQPSFFQMVIYSMQGIVRQGVTRERSTERLKHTGNAFKKNLQIKGAC